MPIDFNQWLGGGASVVKAQIPLRAIIQMSRILDKDVDVEFFRSGAKLPPQTVRIEFDDPSASIDSDTGMSFSRKGTIFGIHGHPELDDTDIDEWDTFTMDDREFTVTNVNRLLTGQVQANFEAVGS